jgi:hypothetical protein
MHSLPPAPSIPPLPMHYALPSFYCFCLGLREYKIKNIKLNTFYFLPLCTQKNSILYKWKLVEYNKIVVGGGREGGLDRFGQLLAIHEDTRKMQQRSSSSS